MELLTKETSKAYLFPYTWFTPEHVDTIVTASLLYEQLNYLDYEQKNRRLVIPMLKGLDTLYQSGEISHPEYLGYESHLSSLHSRGHLRGISVSQIQKVAEEQRISLVEMIEKNYELTKMMNIPQEKASEFVVLSITKASYKILRSVDAHKTRRVREKAMGDGSTHKIPHGTREYDYHPAFSDSGYIPLKWTQAQAILLSYAELACKQNHCPSLALEEIYSTSLESLYRSRISDLEKKQAELESEQRLKDVLFTELLQIECPSLYRVWELNPSSVADMRNRTYELRSRARSSISDIFLEYFEGQTPSRMQMDLVITEELVPKLKELKEEYNNLKQGKSFVQTIKAKLTGCIANLASLGLVQIGLQGLLTPEQQIAVTAIALGAEAIGELGSEGWSIRSRSRRRKDIETHHLWELICFLDMQNPNWSA